MTSTSRERRCACTLIEFTPGSDFDFTGSSVCLYSDTDYINVNGQELHAGMHSDLGKFSLDNAVR